MGHETQLGVHVQWQACHVAGMQTLRRTVRCCTMQVTVILEHMFHPSEMEEEATLREDLEDDIKTECTKMGPVEKVSHPLLLAV